MYDEIINSFRNGDNVPIQLAIGRNAIPGLSGVSRFGTAFSVGTTEETVWNEGGIYPYMSSPRILTISSTDGDDAAAGTGLRSLVITGLVDDYESATEIITLDGANAVSTTKNWIRIFDITGFLVGANGVNIGDVYIGEGALTSGKPAIVYAKIQIGRGRSLMAIYTIPKGCTGHGVVSSFFGGKADEANMRVHIFPFGTCALSFTEVNVFQSSLTKRRLSEYDDIPARTDIEIRCQAITGNVDCTADFELFMVNESEIVKGV